MTHNKPGEKTPFWIDTYGMNMVNKKENLTLIPLFRWFFRLIIYTSLFVFLAISAITADASIVLWALAGFYLLLIISSIYFSKRKISSQKYAIEIQENARSQTKASHIGSAIHVAGHPNLSRNQPVVIALNKGHLSFYSYDSSIPLDTLLLDEVQLVELIGYDDERVPYMGVIDSAAQAIQMVFTRNNSDWTCLFRKMRPLRPIDWYHAIQQSRSQKGFN